MTATLPRIRVVRLPVIDIQDRLRAADDELARLRPEYADAADAAKRAERAREEAIARAATDAEGGTTEKRWAAIVAVAGMGLEEEARYARLKAEVAVLSDRVMANASLLKSAHGQRDVGRYEDGP